MGLYTRSGRGYKPVGRFSGVINPILGLGADDFEEGPKMARGLSRVCRISVAIPRQMTGQYSKTS